MRIEVFYKNILVGRVAEKDNRYYFRYEDDFINSGIELAPITMPLSMSLNKIYDFNHLYFPTFYGLPGLIADSIPDKFGNNILDAWLNKQGKSIQTLSTLERLSYIGSRGMGALEFKPERDFEQKTNKELSLNELSHLSQLINTNHIEAVAKEKNSDLLANLFEIGTSAGGARAKAIVGIHKKTRSIINGQMVLPNNFDYYIVKFDTVNEKSGKSSGICLLEKIYYDMARIAGIPMMPSKLLEENGRYHFATKRFDRTTTGEKIHTQTLCAIGHYNYKDYHNNSYENLFYVARSLNVSYQEREQLFKQMLFNIVARNLDDHSKNFAFIYHNNKWKVAPGYDISYNYDPKGLFTQFHKMSVNGKNTDISKEDILKIAKENSINKPLLLLEQIKEAAAKFPQIASSYGFDKKTATSIYSNFRML
jgi:serine/threonine-protein kinase HipA